MFGYANLGFTPVACVPSCTSAPEIVEFIHAPAAVLAWRRQTLVVFQFTLTAVKTLSDI